jgi:hypothetical protein
MTDAQYAELKAALDEALVLLRGSGGTPVVGEMVHPGPNGLAIVDGLAMAIDEPIRADWKASMEARVMLAQGRIGYEPSNAFNSGLPKRSPRGYPMVYGVGQYGPQPPGRVVYDGQTHDDDSAVEQYKAAVRVRDANVIAQGGRFSPGR